MISRTQNSRRVRACRLEVITRKRVNWASGRGMTDNQRNHARHVWALDSNRRVYVRTGWFENEVVITVVSHLWFVDGYGNKNGQLTVRKTWEDV